MWTEMWIWVFAGRTLILLFLSCRGSYGPNKARNGNIRLNIKMHFCHYRRNSYTVYVSKKLHEISIKLLGNHIFKKWIINYGFYLPILGENKKERKFRDFGKFSALNYNSFIARCIFSEPARKIPGTCWERFIAKLTILTLNVINC